MGNKELLIDSLTYTWFMPELVLAACWAKELWFTDILFGSGDVGNTIHSLGKASIEKTGLGTGIESSFIFDTIVSTVFSKSSFYEGISPHRVLYQAFPSLDSLDKRLKLECPDTLITGTPVASDGWGLADYIFATIQDIVEKHMCDMNTVLGKHYDGGIWYHIGSTFKLKLSERVLRCELENLVFSASEFGCNGVRVKMLPILM